MPIDDHRIRDLRSFNDVTGKSHETAGLYSFLLLDCLVDLAHKVSLDFFKRPQLYTDLDGDEGDEIAELLATLHTRYGTEENIVSKSQRDEIYVSIFGQSGGLPIADGVGDFPRLRNELMEAATAFAERVYDTGLEMLRERVRTTHRPFREFLVGLQGSSLRWSRNRALPRLTEEIAYEILRNKGVTAVFGVSTPANPAWPYTEDSNGDKLVEEISKQLRSDNEPGMPISREQFTNLQRAALRGAEAIATVVDFNEDDATNEDLERLITKVYTWGSALQSLRGV
jgi:hypothetical protein